MTHPRALLAAGLGGAVGTAVDVSLLVLLVEGGAAVPVSTFVAASAGAAVCFVLNKHVAFRDRSPVTLQQVGRFGLVAVTAALLMTLAMKVVAVELGVPYVVAKLACATVVFALWTFPAQRRLVFRPAWRLGVDADPGLSVA